MLLLEEVVEVYLEHKKQMQQSQPQILLLEAVVVVYLVLKRMMVLRNQLLTYLGTHQHQEDKISLHRVFLVVNQTPCSESLLLLVKELNPLQIFLVDNHKQTCLESQQQRKTKKRNQLSLFLEPTNRQMAYLGSLQQKLVKRINQYNLSLGQLIHQQVCLGNLLPKKIKNQNLLNLYLVELVEHLNHQVCLVNPQDKRIKILNQQLGLFLVDNKQTLCSESLQQKRRKMRNQLNRFLANNHQKLVVVFLVNPKPICLEILLLQQAQKLNLLQISLAENQQPTCLGILRQKKARKLNQLSLFLQLHNHQPTYSVINNRLKKNNLTKVQQQLQLKILLIRFQLFQNLVLDSEKTNFHSMGNKITIKLFFLKVLQDLVSKNKTINLLILILV